MIMIIMDYGVNGNMLDGEFKGNVLILETGKKINTIYTYKCFVWTYISPEIKLSTPEDKFSQS